MLKKERLQRICEMVNANGIIHLSDIMENLDVSDMTVRRDLDELEKDGKLIRVRGGAQSVNYNMETELSHQEKSIVKMEEKKEIAIQANQFIHDGDTVFLGPGTTIELLASQIVAKDLRIVTNSLPAFEILSAKDENEVYLVGGQYRKRTGAFTGALANSMLKHFKFSASFISCNGLLDDQVTTSTVDEGEIQRTALNNSRNRYLLVDAHKFNREDFYVYYSLYSMDALITEPGLSADLLEHYEQFTKIIEAGKKEEKET